MSCAVPQGKVNVSFISFFKLLVIFISSIQFDLLTKWPKNCLIDSKNSIIPRQFIFIIKGNSEMLKKNGDLYCQQGNRKVQVFGESCFFGKVIFSFDAKIKIRKYMIIPINLRMWGLTSARGVILGF